LAIGSIGVFCIGLAAAEGLLRLTHPIQAEPSDGFESLHRYSEVYGWELSPGARQFWDDHWMSVNQKGFRGPEPRRSPSGAPRVVMLGDSVTFGTYVGDGETFSDRLAEAGGFEVLNLGVQGYGLGQSLLRLEREGLAYQPQVVVFNICLANDFADIMLPAFLYDARHPKPYFRLLDGRLRLHDEHLQLSVRERLGRTAWSRSLLVRHAAARLSRPREDERPDPAEHWVARRNRALRDERAALELGLALLARARAASEAAGAAFVVAIHPDKDAFKNGSSWSDALRGAPQLAGVEVIDLGQQYQDAGLRGRDLLLDAIGHLTPQGHRRAAELLAAPLQRALARSVARVGIQPTTRG
jgi:hypothetical protein